MDTLQPHERLDYIKFTTAVGLTLNVNVAPNIPTLEQAEDAYVVFVNQHGEMLREWTMPATRATFTIPAIERTPVEAAPEFASDDHSVNINSHNLKINTYLPINIPTCTCSLYLFFIG